MLCLYHQEYNKGYELCNFNYFCYWKKTHYTFENKNKKLWKFLKIFLRFFFEMLCFESLTKNLDFLITDNDCIGKNWAGYGNFDHFKNP